MAIWDKLFKGISEGRLTNLDRQNLAERWRAVEEQRSLGKPSNFKVAVIEADNITDQALKAIFPTQPDMAARLKLARAKFTDRRVYEALWYDHKIRNSLVHEAGFELPAFEAGRILDSYREILQVLGAL